MSSPSGTLKMKAVVWEDSASPTGTDVAACCFHLQCETLLVLSEHGGCKRVRVSVVSTSLKGVVPQTTYSILCIQYTVRTILYCMHNILNVHHTVCTIYCKYSILYAQYTECTSHCMHNILYVQDTLCTVYCTYIILYLRCLVRTVYCILYVQYYTVCTIYWTYITLYAQYTVRTLYCTYSVLYVRYTVYCTYGILYTQDTVDAVKWCPTYFPMCFMFGIFRFMLVFLYTKIVLIFLQLWL